MTARVRVFTVDRGCERLDCTDKQFAIFPRRVLQVADEPLDLVSHHVEGGAEIAEFRAARYFDSFREVTGRDSMCAAREFSHGVRQLLREKDTDEDRYERGDKTDPENLPTHVRH